MMNILILLTLIIVMYLAACAMEQLPGVFSGFLWVLGTPL